MAATDPWFDAIARRTALPESGGRALLEQGFLVLKRSIPPGELATLSRAYDAAVAHADPADVKAGSTTTRVPDLVNRGPEFDGIYLHPPLLDACCRIIGQPFRLSALVARTLHPGAHPRRLHVDFPADESGWPMAGFIFMVDEFRADNGATRFLRRSHGTHNAEDMLRQAVPAMGPAGSMIIYNGSVWHEHGPNRTDFPRRSIQGAFIRRTEKPALDWRSRMHPETLARLTPLARYLLDLE